MFEIIQPELIIIFNQLKISSLKSLLIIQPTKKLIQQTEKIQKIMTQFININIASGMLQAQFNLHFWFIFLLTVISCHKMPKFTTEDILDPVKLRPYMFKTQITGEMNVMLPSKQNVDIKGQVVSEEYQIDMVKGKQQLLPKELFNQTTMYMYAGQTTKGYRASFPGPTIIAKKDKPIKIKWKNNIPGPHILPVDLNYPFKSDQAFTKQVPVVPHAHGISTNTSSDGEPQAYWTSTGLKSASYRSQEPCSPNEAVYYYPNQQQTSNNWYHDHAIGITRLNVYAGLAGLYKITQANNSNEQKITQRYGSDVSQNNVRYLIVTDKTFTNEGELFYPIDTGNPSFTSWVPEFFGNTMLVNGVLWPKMTLKRGKYRFVLLNACQNRYLNLWFENNGKNIPIELIRVDGDYYQQQIVVSQLFATISSRIQFIVDFSYAQGQVTLKNNAAAPYPSGDPMNLDPQFTGQLMRFIIQTQQYNLSIDEEEFNVQSLKQRISQIKGFGKDNQAPATYPKFPEGERVYSTLFQVTNEDDDVDAMFIDGMAMMNGMNCTKSTYDLNKTYDFYIINLTPDTHPIHFHLINIQKVKQFPINIPAYTAQYFKQNGGMPSRHGFSKPHIELNPEPYRTGSDQLPKQYEKVFRDTIDAHPGYVTVLRVKFAKNDGTLWKSFDARQQRYVWHCHMLEHEDNEMMKYFCLK